MKPKIKGMTSLEIAVIVAIVLIIAVAVGWYLYTTFVASTTGQPRLNVVSAEVYNSQGQLSLTLVNPGPIDVELGSIELAGTIVGQGGNEINCPGSQTGNVGPVIKVGQQTKCTVPLNSKYTTGTMLPGRVILSGGQSFPFNAIVKP
ncbi:MAG: class III signal peptide [Pyrobaculum sp.]